jgi:hypothetical protein
MLNGDYGFGGDKVMSTEDINLVFGQPVEVVVQETYKAPAISPFEFVNAINHEKNYNHTNFYFSVGSSYY